METAYVCDAIRTPFGRYGGALASIRTDDLAAIPLKALVERNVGVDWNAVDDVVYGPSCSQVCPRKCQAQPLTGSAARAWRPSRPPREPSSPAKRTS